MNDAARRERFIDSFPVDLATWIYQPEQYLQN
jgi:hypothetical protein